MVIHIYEHLSSHMKTKELYFFKSGETALYAELILGLRAQFRHGCGKYEGQKAISVAGL